MGLVLNAGVAGWAPTNHPFKAAAPDTEFLPLALTCAVGQGPAPVAVLLAHAAVVAHQAAGPLAGVVDGGPEREHVPREDGVGGHTRMPAGYG